MMNPTTNKDAKSAAIAPKSALPPIMLLIERYHHLAVLTHSEWSIHLRIQLAGNS